ncbi:MAG: asparagine synthetase B family protein [Pyrinomonadaceae bacterium]
MSGIVGIINLDGAPVDRELLGRMTDFMSFRGPDAQEIWIDGNVGFGHTMLRTTFEAETEKQPITLDGKVWLTADARIDGRAELIAELEAKLQRRLRVSIPRNDHWSSPNGNGSHSKAHDTDPRVPNDAELILYSYEAWGEDCVKHLIGDFAFAIWDSRQRRLFCARDHFGIRPFYYAYLSNHLLFSNTLKCLRLHQSVSSQLNDEAVGDFLVFDMNYNLFTTVFADIQRLPPAHTLIWTEDEPRLSCYWTLPVDGRVRYKRSKEYVEHFKQLLDVSVGDRLRTDRVGVLMSGGLDSTTVAATAHTLFTRRGGPFDLRAYTVVYEDLIKDQEGYYAGLAAEALKIPINYVVADNYKLFEQFEHLKLDRSEPIPEPLIAIVANQYWQLARHCRIALYGQGPDAVLSTFFSRHMSSLIKSGHWTQAFMDLVGYAFWNRRLPPIGVRTFLRRSKGWNEPPAAKELPLWISRAFAARIGLQQRIREAYVQSKPSHATHPLAHNLLVSPFWVFVFERDNADGAFAPIENCYPFFDLRLVTYLLAIPAARWCMNKRLIREAMRGILPETVRLRPKTPLAGDVLLARISRGEQAIIKDFDALPELSKYVIPPSTQALECCDSDELWNKIRLLSFYDWMAHAGA